MDQIQSVLALGAHPDDLELGCGATLAKLASRGVPITAVILSEGGCGAGPHFAYRRLHQTQPSCPAR